MIRAPKCDRPVLPEGPPPAERVWEPVIPDYILSRLQQIPNNTLVHVPVAFRERLCKILTKSNLALVGGAVTVKAVDGALVCDWIMKWNEWDELQNSLELNMIFEKFTAILKKAAGKGKGKAKTL